jgi:hypothetical protein
MLASCAPNVVPVGITGETATPHSPIKASHSAVIDGAPIHLRELLTSQTPVGARVVARYALSGPRQPLPAAPLLPLTPQPAPLVPALDRKLRALPR